MKRNYILIMFLCAMVLYSCKKELSNTTSEPQVNVYVAGWESNGVHQVAKYWKNGVAVSLSDGSKNEGVVGIAVSGNDVYVGGIEYSNTAPYNASVKYWKNGVPVNLTDGSNHTLTSSIAVSGNDVYVAGSEINGTNHVAKYWKNGTAVILAPAQGFDFSYAGGMTVAEGNVYVAGESSDGNDRIAEYWKNGRPVRSSGTLLVQALSLFQGIMYMYRVLWRIILP